LIRKKENGLIFKELLRLFWRDERFQAGEILRIFPGRECG
jgi:hypothetical protein